MIKESFCPLKGYEKLFTVAYLVKQQQVKALFGGITNVFKPF